MAIDDEKLDEIEARAEAATDGPWRVEPYSEAHKGSFIVVSADGTELFDADAHYNECILAAHARQDVPALVAEVRRLRAVLEDMRDVYESAWNHGDVGDKTADEMDALAREALEAD